MCSSRHCLPLLLSLFFFSCQAGWAGQTPFWLGEEEDCFSNPRSESCRYFKYPAHLSRNNLTDLCGQMSFMPGCSIRNTCTVPQQVSESLQPFCRPLSLLNDICLNDPGMERMSGCTAFHRLCSPGSMVEQCTDEASLPHLPGTVKVWAGIQSICSEMSMRGCDDCVTQIGEQFPKCDMLSTYSRLCIAMPDMRQCREWKLMCDAIPDSVYCSIAASHLNPPSMKMYFHGGIHDYILFEDWVPRTNYQYALSCVIVFILGFSLEGIKIASVHLEKFWIQQDLLRSENSEPYTFRCLFIQDVPRAAVAFITQTTVYGVMLITMTFNIGIFLATVAGIGFGAGALRRFLPKVTASSQTESAETVDFCC